ncbi:uncharacterized protein EV420DRAFT_1672100 [Desarmillaria tabescens]|uniref:CxC2-like cysteine cluster KDZ transposase-associated domain-containing protein n=1 Tax=Armillaria tabescens TaxID=1929756 RepID=A0AA39J9U2_ARMTA|nr:uncharacterized protein EV420DRAFT_1672100 [Desarmillaria tabescens]KAK0436813.1 hypothetical protein EV420DRAFT_1672100 [Desarmillaria tabescens]
MSVRTTAIPIASASVPSSLENEPPSPPPAFDSSTLLSGMSAMSFLDPDLVAPAEVTDSDAQGTWWDRPLGDHPLLVWTSQREQFLEEVLRLEAPISGTSGNCHRCDAEQGSYRCVSCFNGRLLCQGCIVREHNSTPLHKVEEWTGIYFKKTSLAELGLVMQLGHRLGTKCVLPAVIKSFVVIDVDGVHTVQMAFCNCTQSIPRHVQLLQSRLWPATTIYPQTAATFRVLHLFQVLSFMSKVSAYEFYHTLARLSDNTGLHPPPDRYDTFLQIMREWCHLRTLKRFGRGHETGGIGGMSPGELVLRCPACPHPQVNLPNGFAANLEKRWLYCLFLAVDANFRLRRLNVSSEESDPSLNKGYAYFVEEEAFRSHLEKYGKIIAAEEKSTCNNHDAVKLANSRGGQGAAATGVGAVVCGRHDMKRPLSVRDLQKGERYINMDYFILQTLSCDTPPDLVISYDIACQWHKNLFVRISKYPSSLQPHQLEKNILYLVPKFHLPAHVLLCRNNFSFNFSAKVGRTDGEAPERGWAATNALANSTKEMGPGSCRDTLDDHFGDYNWRKIIIMGRRSDFMLYLCSDPFSARSQQVAEFISYEDALQEKHSEAIREWRIMVLAWEQDRKKPNPFAPSLRPVTENAVHLELAREEKTETHFEIRHDISPSEFIAQGLQLEEAQVRLLADMNGLGIHSTDLQRTRVQQHANRIARKIEAWIEVQKVYMPRTTLLRTRDDDSRAPGVEVHPSKIPLYLPSHAVRLNAINVTTHKTILEDERRLRLAQAHDTLGTLRDHLLLKSYLVIWRQRFSQGQRYGTKANTLMHRVDTKIEADAARYRRIYAALEVVSTRLNQHEWKSGLSPLKTEDVRGLSSYNEAESEGHRTLSWIWKTNLQGGEKGLQEALRIEWCKSRARAQRYQEECELLAEEMRRIQATFEYYRDLWKGREMRTSLPGAKAYALRQAALWSDLRTSAAVQWSELLATLPPASGGLDPTIDLDSRLCIVT